MVTLGDSSGSFSIGDRLFPVGAGIVCGTRRQYVFEVLWLQWVCGPACAGLALIGRWKRPLSWCPSSGTVWSEPVLPPSS